MNRLFKFGALLVVSSALLTACNGRKILHGSGAHFKHPSALSSSAKISRPSAEPEADSRENPLISVWFVKPDASSMKFLSVVRKTTHTDRLTAAIEELLDGPSSHETKDGLGTEIPRGTVLIGVKRNGSDVELNLSRRFASGGGSTSFLTRLEQLKKTVAEPAGASNVYLSVEGRRLNVEEGEGIEIHQPINR